MKFATSDLNDCYPVHKLTEGQNRHEQSHFPVLHADKNKTNRSLKLSSIDKLGFGYKFNMRKQIHFNEIQINNTFCFNMSK